jgi:hypothetical protein
LLQLNNKSPFSPAIALFPDVDGIDTLYLIIKGTFKLENRLEISEAQLPPKEADEYWGDPSNSSLKYASDYHIGKKATDIALVGSAWPYNERMVSQLDVVLTVAERQKILRVYGKRQWRHKLITPPQPFEFMPIRYEYAYGGVHIMNHENSEVLAEEFNPIGIGFPGKRKLTEFEGQLLPNIEDPEQPLKNPGDISRPAGFGFIAPSWLPRRQYAGTYDGEWQKKRMPYLPEDFDKRFFNCAHPDLVFDRYLQGGEPVEIEHVSPNGPLNFNIPRCHFINRFKFANRIEEPCFNMETVLIEPDDRRLSLVWRAEVRCDKEALNIREIEIELKEITL